MTLLPQLLMLLLLVDVVAAVSESRAKESQMSQTERREPPFST
jgi:hypothetical protein